MDALPANLSAEMMADDDDEEEITESLDQTGTGMGETFNSEAPSEFTAGEITGTDMEMSTTMPQSTMEGLIQLLSVCYLGHKNV